MLKRTAWIWLAGAVAWLVGGLLSLRVHAVQRAELSFLVAALFVIAWLYYRGQSR